MRRFGYRALMGVLLSSVVFVSASAGQEATTPGKSAGSIVTLPAAQVADFWLTLQVKPESQGLEFHGFVPDRSSLDKLSALAGADTKGVTIADGAPSAYAAGLAFALDAAEHLAEGRIALRSNVVTIKGVAKSEADESALNEMSKSGVPAGVVLALLEVSAPKASEVAPAAATGAAPAASAAAAQAPAAASEPAASEAPTQTDVTESAEAAEPTAAAGAEVSPPTASAIDPNYAFKASRVAGGAVVLSGAVPTDPAMRYFGVVAGSAPTTGLSIADGAPETFIADAIGGLRALMKLSDGELAFEGGKWTLQGKASSVGDLTNAKAELAALPDASEWSIELAGPAPNDICRTQVAQFAGTHTILFQSGSARMTDESRGALKDLAAILEQCPDATVHVEGHTDSDDDADANLALSVARAEAVTAVLVEEGVKDTRLYAIGYGETVPIASNDTAAGKQQNRRIVFTVLDEHK
ncbi:OmpA family protein [Devosia sp. D6-9]|nr:OmpA family protein [Devosia sp. D6-9]